MKKKLKDNLVGISFRTSPEMKEKLELLAKQEDRSLTGQIIALLKKILNMK